MSTQDKSLLGKLAEKASDVAADAIDMAKDAGSAIADGAETLAETAGDVVEGAVDMAKDAGAAIADGVEAAADKVGDIAEGAVDIAKDVTDSGKDKNA